MNTKKEYYQIIVGVGIYGATSAYKTKLEGKHSLVIDIRSHIGGNMYCKSIDTINDERNNNYYRKDKELVDYKQNVTIGGRLVDCKHYDIAPIIEKVLEFRL